MYWWRSAFNEVNYWVLHTIKSNTRSPIQEAQKEVMITLFVWLWKDKWVSDEIWLAAFDLWLSIQGQQKATFYIKPIFMVIKWVEYKFRVAHLFGLSCKWMGKLISWLKLTCDVLYIMSAGGGAGARLEVEEKSTFQVKM